MHDVVNLVRDVDAIPVGFPSFKISGELLDQIFMIIEKINDLQDL